MPPTRSRIIDTLYFGKYTAAELPGAMPPTASSCTTPTTTPSTPSMSPRPRPLLEAGWDCKALPCTKKVDGVSKNLEITLITTDRADRQKLAQVIQAQWKADQRRRQPAVPLWPWPVRRLLGGGPLYCRTFDAAIYTWVGGDDPGSGASTTAPASRPRRTTGPARTTPAGATRKLTRP